MGLIIILVFLAVFAVVALLAAATGTGASQQDKQMLARLDSALATNKTKSDMSDLLVDIRKNELLSTIPWIDKMLRRVELTPRLRRLLYQADLKWTVGGLMMMCAGCFAGPRISDLSSHRRVAVWTSGRPGYWIRAHRFRHVQANQAPGQI